MYLVQYDETCLLLWDIIQCGILNLFIKICRGLFSKWIWSGTGQARGGWELLRRPTLGAYVYGIWAKKSNDRDTRSSFLWVFSETLPYSVAFYDRQGTMLSSSKMRLQNLYSCDCGDDSSVQFFTHESQIIHYINIHHTHTGIQMHVH